MGLILVTKRPFFTLFGPRGNIWLGFFTNGLLFSGRSEKFFTNFKVSPDNKFLAFLGNDGYIILLSGKVSWCYSV